MTSESQQLHQYFSEIPLFPLTTLPSTTYGTNNFKLAFDAAYHSHAQVEDASQEQISGGFMPAPIPRVVHDIRRATHADRTDADNITRNKMLSAHPGLPLKCIVLRGSRGSDFQCNKAFASEEELNKHIQGHFKNVRFICSCGRTFTKRLYAERHMQ